MKREIGIWLDTREASFIELSDGDARVTVVTSEIEEFHPIGGSRSNVAYGPVDTISESKYVERRKHQENDYFDKIIGLFQSGDVLIIFGPAQTRNKFHNRIQSKSLPHIKILACLKADSMTENQKIAYVREFFKK